MGTLLLILFIVFIVWPLIKAAWRIHTLRSQVNQAFRTAQQQAQANARQAKQSSRPAGWQQADHQKKFDQSDGEYVEWEEVEIDSATISSDSTETEIDQTHIDVTTTQVSDADWEEIK